MSKFADYVALHYADPSEVMAAHFADAIAAAASVGALLDAMPTLDGSRHYLADLKGHNDKRHYYRANLETDKDGTVWPCITFGTFKHGSETAYWKPRDIVWHEFQAANDIAVPSPDRRAEYHRRAAALQAKSDAARAAREAQAEQGRHAAAEAAGVVWDAATDCASHAYLSAKGVHSYGLRVASDDYRTSLWNDQDSEWQDVFAARAGELLVPMIDASGKLWNVQRIDSSGRKRFLMGGRKRGTFHRIEGSGLAWLAEGYATAATVHAATGTAVVVAFDAGNLREVAQELAAQVGAVAADNDENAAGQKGAEAAGLPYTMPPTVGHDWNDHAAQFDLRSVAELLALAASTKQTTAAPEPANNNGPQPLDKPLDAPEAIYHPDQIVWKRDKETGEWAFHQAKGTAENLARLVRAYGVRIRYNELSRDVEISVNGELPTGDLARNVSLSTVEDLCRINEYPYTAAAGHLDRIAAQDAYNPALDWVKSQPWNGGENIRALFDCLTLADKSKAEVSWTLFRKWFLGAAAILSGRARKFEHVLVLVDPMGGIGKTRFFNTLSPKDLQADGITLNPDDKDSVLQVVSKWLVELGEIGATFSKSDIESLKAFLSRDTDELRPAYARAANRYQRRTAFFGSVNSVQFLMDDTNNRRFWPIQVVGVDYQHNIDVQQAWAEALARVEAGETWHLDQDENRAIGEHNETFRSKDRVEEMILSLYDPAAIRSRYLSASDVLNEIGLQNAKVGDTRKAGTILRKLFPCKVSRGVTVYHMPTAMMEARRFAVVGDRYADRPI